MVKELDMTKLLEDFGMESGGYGNGHDQFMICGKNLDAKPLFEMLVDRDLFDLTCEGEVKDDCITFQAHAIRFEYGDLLRAISKAYPEATCYWNDCWGNEVEFDCLKNGKGCTDYTIDIAKDEDWPDADEGEEDEYRSFEATIIDNVTSNKMHIGGGMVYADDVENFYEKIKTINKTPSLSEVPSTELLSEIKRRKLENIFYEDIKEKIILELNPTDEMEAEIIDMIRSI